MEYISNINKRAGEIIRKLIIRRPLPPQYYKSIEIYYWRRTIKCQENKEVHLLHFFKKFNFFCPLLAYLDSSLISRVNSPKMSL